MNASLHHAIDPGRFATFILAVASRREMTLRYCNAGHNPGLLVHRGDLVLLPASGVPLGMFAESIYTQSECRFEPGDVVVLFSDGITECPWKDAMYGDERLQALVTTLARGPASAAEIGRAILDDVRAFCHGQLGADDITLVVVKRRT
jgi:sigma-B regulation protein RsbU (phosphoserine phosphatase)